MRIDGEKLKKARMLRGLPKLPAAYKPVTTRDLATANLKQRAF